MDVASNKVAEVIVRFPRESARRANKRTRSVRGARKRSTLPKELICHTGISMRNAPRRRELSADESSLLYSRGVRKGPRCDSASFQTDECSRMRGQVNTFRSREVSCLLRRRGDAWPVGSPRIFLFCMAVLARSSASEAGDADQHGSSLGQNL